jgi:hypothetical protein
MRFLIGFLFLIIPLQALAFTSPKIVDEGTLGSTANFLGQVQVLSEQIRITFLEDNMKARFEIEYKIRGETGRSRGGMQFDAGREVEGSNFSKTFRIWVDGVEITDWEGEEFPAGKETMKYCVSGGFGESIFLNEFRTYEFDMSGAEQVVKIQYEARPWKNRVGYVAEFKYCFSFLPNYNWHLDRDCEIVLDSPALDWEMITNVHEPDPAGRPGVWLWKGEDHQDTTLSVWLSPKVSKLSRVFIWLGPFGFFVLAAIVLALIHLFKMHRFRRKNQQKWVSSQLISWSIVAPVVASFIGIFSESLIFSTIPDEIQGIGALGNGVILFMLLPLVACPVWFLVMWIPDTVWRLWFRKKGRVPDNN